MGAGACSGAFVFPVKLFSGKAQDATRDEDDIWVGSDEFVLPHMEACHIGFSIYRILRILYFEQGQEIQVISFEEKASSMDFDGDVGLFHGKVTAFSEEWNYFGRFISNSWTSYVFLT